MAGPLTGIRVVEMAHVISGPYGGMLLGDLGAEVIKVEMPGTGDYFRQWDAKEGAIRPPFAGYNRGKKSVTINIRNESGREVYKKLVATADVVVENFRPGALEKYGIGYEDLSKDNPGLIYCSVSGMGPSGPYRDRPTYDQIAQAMSGLWSQLTEMDDPEPVGPAICDQLTGMFTAYGILGALVGRGMTGKGQQLDVSMLGAGIAFNPASIAEYMMEGKIADKFSRPHQSQSYAFVGSDDKPFAIHLSTPPKFWQGLVTVAGHPEFVDDPRFLTKRSRIERYDEIHDLLQESFRSRPRAEWLELLEESDVPCGPLYNIPEALADPQVQHLGMVQTFGDGDRALDLVGFPVAYGNTACEAGLPPPLLGEHSTEVLMDMGYTEEDLARLAEEEAI